MNGQARYFAGDAAELAVAREYSKSGHSVDRRRWRGKSGEIDLILRQEDGIVFVEVKSAKTLHDAAYALGPRQQARLLAAANEFLATEPGGLETNARFDVALVDHSGTIEVLENALAA